MTSDQAIERYIYSRQIPISTGHAPIPVQSAFGGLAIYRLASALPCDYLGLDADGLETCEHVSFNTKIAERGPLYIYPSLRNRAPQEHLSAKWQPLEDARELKLKDNTRECRLLAPRDHQLDIYREQYPLYDRRLPFLSRLAYLAAPDKCIIDIGANIGDSIALLRLAGCESHIIAIEPSRSYFTYLEANQLALPEIFHDVEIIQAFVGPPGQHLHLTESRGTATVRVLKNSEHIMQKEECPQTVSLDTLTNRPVSLIKTDTDGYDATVISTNLSFIRKHLPILWVETDTGKYDNLHEWSHVLSDLLATHPFICVFDNFGFLINYGPAIDKQQLVLDLIQYSRRTKLSASGEPRIYYLDLALFPAQYADVYSKFTAELAEANL
ncbi:FkbM family methyltransferase [Methylococcus sp. EFPC2]|uniref:FkbM family methyltransferase n=1 Tax=Methylococcus sp. EFPC2 TaxID=2812648 RepID=UPI0019686209|nr:FkbM family methyltransferase [Methylococcus sp. EFPC2]QSA95592.1 FkbM family methyltransferase [Methylococcus sp. EFPC2]